MSGSFSWISTAVWWNRPKLLLESCKQAQVSWLLAPEIAVRASKHPYPYTVKCLFVMSQRACAPALFAPIFYIIRFCSFLGKCSWCFYSSFVVNISRWPPREMTQDLHVWQLLIISCTPWDDTFLKGSSWCKLVSESELLRPGWLPHAHKTMICHFYAH